MRSKKLVGIVVRVVDSIKAAGTDTAAATFALVIIDDGFLIYICNSIASALLRTASAAAAELLTDSRLSACVLLHFSGTASAAHTDIFDGTAETGGLMTFEMGQADKDVGVHNRVSDEGRLAVLSVYDRNFHLVGSSKTVTDDDLTAGGDRVEAIEVCTV